MNKLNIYSHFCGNSKRTTNHYGLVMSFTRLIIQHNSKNDRQWRFEAANSNYWCQQADMLIVA